MFARKMTMTLLGMVALVPKTLGVNQDAQTMPAKDGNDIPQQQMSSPAGATLPFELGSGFLIVVRGRIGQLTGLRFVLDSGTTHTLLDAKLADRIGLTTREGSVLHFDRNVRISWGNVPELQAGPLTLKNARVMVGDLSRLTEFADGIDGVIGLDALRMSSAIEINFETRLLTFRIPGASPAPADQTFQQAFLVRLDVRGKTLRLVLDTGARDVFLFEDRIHKHAPSLECRHSAWRDRTGPLIATIAERSEFHIGAREVRSAFLMRKAPDSLPEDIDGYLGLSVLNAKYVQMNFAANRLRYVEMESTGIVRASADGSENHGTRNKALAARMALVAVQ